MGRHASEPTLARPGRQTPRLAAARTGDWPLPRHRRRLTDDRRARGLRSARLTKALVAVTFVGVFVCTPEVMTAMSRGFTTIFTGQGIEDVAPARLTPPTPQP